MLSTYNYDFGKKKIYDIYKDGQVGSFLNILEKNSKK